MPVRFALVLSGLLLASCATLPPPVPVDARSEAATADATRGRSGHLAIWSGGSGSPSRRINAGFVAGTEPPGDLVLRDFQGALLERVPGARLTDLDVTSMPLESSFSVVVAGTERSSGRTRITLFRLNSEGDQTMRPWGRITTDLSDPRGFCMRQVEGVVQAVAFDRRGEARQFVISETATGEALVRETRRFRIPDPGHGCAIANVDGHLYIGHARRGFWRYPLDARSSLPPTRLTGEGPAILPRGASLSLFSANLQVFLASLDHDRSAVSIWRADRAGLTWLGRVEVRDAADGRRVGRLTGVDVYGYGLEGFPDGLMAVRGPARSGISDIRYVDLSEVQRALAR